MIRGCMWIALHANAVKRASTVLLSQQGGCGNLSI